MKKTLIVIDMQNDFIDGALGTKEATEIVDNVKKIIDDYHSRNDEIIYTRDTHFENYPDTNEGRHLPVKHCIKDSYGWEIADGLYIEGSVIIDKPTFGYTDWKKYNFEDVCLVGLCTDICVVSNALIIKAIYPEINVSVISDCTAGVTEKSKQAALETMKMCQIDIL